MENSKYKPSIPTLAFFSLFPFCVTLVAFSFEFAFFVSYPAGKVLMLAIPVIVWMRAGFTRRAALDHAGFHKTTLIPGVVTGVVFGAAIIFAFSFAFRDVLDPAPVARKVTSLGLTDYYLWIALFLSVENSFTEELYFRSFLYGRFKLRFSSSLWVCVVLGFVFGLHHLLTLANFFPLPYALLFFAATVVVGAFWTAMRLMGYSIIDCYISHMLADFAVFWAGWEMIQREAGG